MKEQIEALIAELVERAAQHLDADAQDLRGWADRLTAILATDAGGWRSMDTAPRDGTIITAAGWDWGKVGGRRHIHRCSWRDGAWVDATNDGSTLTFLTHYHVGSSLEPPPQEPPR